MKIEQLLQHHGIAENPFAQEDATTDHVFQKSLGLPRADSAGNGADPRNNGVPLTTHHPAWDKIFSNPRNPATAVVFGEKGSGKTAIRLQIVAELRDHNASHPDSKAFVIEYDDFNPFLDCFQERVGKLRASSDRVLRHWRLWDHMDAILSLGVSKLIHCVVGGGRRDDASGEPIDVKQLAALPHEQKRDLLMLAALYDHTLDVATPARWEQLRRKLRFGTWRANWDWWAALAVTLLTAGALLYSESLRKTTGLWGLLPIPLAWLPWACRQARLLWTSWRVSRQIRVIEHHPNVLRRLLAKFSRQDLLGQPIPARDRSDDRYELLKKFQEILKSLGYSNVVVIVDRVDEPHLINGSPERMRDFIWPMFDNKFLKHPGLALKLLLPDDLVYYLDRESKEFYERSRLDKQNLVRSLDWTGEALYDVASDRLAACALDPDKRPSVRDLFDETVDQRELVNVFAGLRVPRHLFKFLHRLLVDHCSHYTDDQPQWKINHETLSRTLALYHRDLAAYDKGAGTG
ncbi:MAG: DUF1109 domain-containing protein [Planctomycetota bacterium]|nr:MAG: DUF1109 domain-containing protein [Planctomycetota bacterium]